MEGNIISIHNNEATVSADLYGGAIIDFHLNAYPVNPLSARFTKEQMPENNKAGAAYQGHFICLGRWGLPSAGEIKAGIPNHGQAANIQWQLNHATGMSCNMHAQALQEGLHIERSIRLDPSSPLYLVTEKVTNTNALGRLYNMVQHPMLTPPFLTDATIINSNADKGFNQAYTNKPEEYLSQWPFGICADGSTIDLQNPVQPYNSVFSFAVNAADDIGWVTAYSPDYNLLFGYYWNRHHYPWIHCWQYWEKETIKYRGIEFGTAGIHKPFNEILNDAPELFDQKTYSYIDAGEKITRRYSSFITAPGKDFTGVEKIQLKKDAIHVLPKNNLPEIIIQANFSHDISK